MLTFENLAYAIPSFAVFCFITYIVAAITWAFAALAYRGWKRTLIIAEGFIIIIVFIGLVKLGYMLYISGASEAIGELSSLLFSIVEFSRLAKERLVS